MEAEALKKKADEVNKASGGVQEDPSDMQKSLDERLKRLINAAPAMLFMKGSPDAPGKDP